MKLHYRSASLIFRRTNEWIDHHVNKLCKSFAFSSSQSSHWLIDEFIIIMIIEKNLDGFVVEEKEKERSLAKKKKKKKNTQNLFSQYTV